MAPDLWLPGIPRVTPTNQAPIPLGLQGRGKRLFTWHTFEAPYTLSATAGARYTNSQNSTPTFCFNPVTGELVQQLPANVGARTLQANGPYQHTNAYGDIHMQVEVIGYAARPFARDLTAAGAASLVKLMNFLRSWGIPDQWAFTGMAVPPATYAAASVGRGQPDRSGHAVHSRWWANDHWDPGAIAPPWTLAPGNSYAPAPPPRKPETPKPDPNKGFPGEHLEQIESQLDALGYEAADVWARVRAYQEDHGLTTDGLPGPITAKSIGETMTTLKDVASDVTSIKNALTGPGVRDPFNDKGARVPLANLMWANGHRGSETNARLRRLEATTEGYRVALEALASREGADPAAIQAAVEAGVSAALGKVEADVRLVIETGGA